MDKTHYLNKLKELRTTFGNTPMLKIELSYKGELKTFYVKEEYVSPTRSIKVRPAYQIIYDAIVFDKLKPNQPVIEVTSGNMGISLAYICKYLGNPITIIMPKNMSKERIDAIKEFKADLKLSDDFLSSFELAKSYEEKGYFPTHQFDNISNVNSQKELAKEILSQTKDFDAFVSGVGTGGTLIGAGSYLKEKNNTKIVAIDPKEASLLKYGHSIGHHKIQGLSDEIIPSLYNKDIVDHIIEVSSDDAICLAKKLRTQCDIHVGISSGGNLIGGILSPYQKIATVFADDDSRYYSTDLFNDDIKSELVDNISIISVKRIK